MEIFCFLFVSLLHFFSEWVINAADFLWNGPILVSLLLGGGFILLIRSKFIPLLHFNHAFKLLKKKSNSSEGISSVESVSSHVGGIVGMGNISGVAIAIIMGGPGAIFWMWVTAFFGMITKFYTCSLAVMYRDKKDGQFVGGPMYVISKGLGKNWKFLAYIFCFFGLLGVSPIFQSNQIVEIINSVFLKNNVLYINQFISDFIIGICISIVVSMVIFGGIKRIGRVASKLAPFMVILYMVVVFYIIIDNYTKIIPTINLIITDAFYANSVLGGALGSLILIGARRASFSNEAGIGTAPIIHAASKTDNPIQEGMVSMIGPFIDTIVVCTLTALCILVSGTWENNTYAGIAVVAQAFNDSLPILGPYLLLICTLSFAITTLFSLSFFGERCLAYLIGERYSFIYRYIYIVLILVGSTSSLKFVISLIDLSYGIMAFPTMISVLLLSYKIDKTSNKYFQTLNNGK